ncbi:hypothetical protein [Geotalea toluenoxydans]|uniref:hypothetical protein n=1 Tax=Geotalea toluenoxydans TaxID=421624 RepID=UPI0006D0CE8F|nr:hypothetical protein [Geotalea toluenoxydans]
MKSEERRAKSEERRAKSEELRQRRRWAFFQLKGLFMLKNVRMQGAKERAAEHTSVCEQRRDAVNAADGRFSA